MSVVAQVQQILREETRVFVEGSPDQFYYPYKTTLIVAQKATPM